MPTMHLTPTGGLAPAAVGPELRIDVGRMGGPYRFTAQGGFTGSTTLQHKIGGTWKTLATMITGDELVVEGPVQDVRVNGTHTGLNAEVVCTMVM